MKRLIKIYKMPYPMNIKNFKRIHFYVIFLLDLDPFHVYKYADFGKIIMEHIERNNLQCIDDYRSFNLDEKLYSLFNISSIITYYRVKGSLYDNSYEKHCKCNMKYKDIYSYMNGFFIDNYDNFNNCENDVILHKFDMKYLNRNKFHMTYINRSKYDREVILSLYLHKYKMRTVHHKLFMFFTNIELIQFIFHPDNIHYWINLVDNVNLKYFNDYESIMQK